MYSALPAALVGVELAPLEVDVGVVPLFLVVEEAVAEEKDDDVLFPVALAPYPDVGEPGEGGVEVPLDAGVVAGV